MWSEQLNVDKFLPNWRPQPGYGGLDGGLLGSCGVNLVSRVSLHCAHVQESGSQRLSFAFPAISSGPRPRQVTSRKVPNNQKSEVLDFASGEALQRQLSFGVPSGDHIVVPGCIFWNALSFGAISAGVLGAANLCLDVAKETD